MSYLDAIAIVVLSVAAGWATFRLVEAYLEDLRTFFDLEDEG